MKKVKEELKSIHKYATPDEIKDLIYKNLKTFKLNNQVFDYFCQDNYLGGQRWFVKCPKCGSNCFRLYLPQANSGREQRYLCRVCHRLKNVSALMGATSKYTKVVKPLKNLEKIKKALLKRGITPEKAAPLLDAYDKIEKQLETSAEYRLWKFQQRYKASK
jgi:hypothetical protein